MTGRQRPGSRGVGWDEVFDAGKSGWDSITDFLAVAHALAADSDLILDVGCGRGAAADDTSRRPFHDLRGEGRSVLGIDVDPAARANPMVDEFRLIDPTDSWPVETGTVDLAFCDYVLEHVADPVGFVGELQRVLRPGGAFVARTVSRYSPLSLVARLVPNDRHGRVIDVVQPDRPAVDVFPTVYLMNSERALRPLFDDNFVWTVRHRVGLEQYLLRWPRGARAVMAVEPRLPAAMQTTLVLYARKRAQ